MPKRLDFLAATSAAAIVPAGFVRGAAIPPSFDFRDPYSGIFMSFGLWYIMCENNTAMTERGFESAEAAVEWFRANRDAGVKHGWPDDLLDVVAADTALQSPEGKTLGDNAYSVVNALWYYTWVQKVGIEALSDPMFGIDARAEYEAAQQDIEWGRTWGGD